MREDLIESVAAQLGDSGWARVRDLVSEDEIADLRAEVEALLAAGAFVDAAVGGKDPTRRPEIRSDVIHWLEGVGDAGPADRYLQQMQSLRDALNRALYLGLDAFDGHFAVYPPGSLYRRHLDASPRHTRRRVVTCITYLNPSWQPTDGGQLRIYLGGDGDERSVDVLPEAGTTVLFLAEQIEHEVLPSYRRRTSVTGWFERRR